MEQRTVGMYKITSKIIENLILIKSIIKINMVFMIIDLLTCYFRLYLLTELIDQPSSNNFLILALVYNIYLFGYLSTLYITCLFAIYFGLEHRPMMGQLLKQIDRMIRRRPPLAKIWHMGQPYIGLMITTWHRVYQHPMFSYHWVLIRGIGAYIQRLIQGLMIQMVTDTQLRVELDQLHKILTSN